MKIVFLDIDGVLNSHKLMKKMGHEDYDLDDLIDPDAVSLLNNRTDATGASIVVSSSWRLNYLGQPQGLTRLCALLKDRHGIKAPIIGMTPEKRNALRNVRGKEIQTWLDCAPVQVDDFIIIDDDSDMGRLRNKQIKTSMIDGLRIDHVEEGIRRLGAIPSTDASVPKKEGDDD